LAVKRRDCKWGKRKALAGCAGFPHRRQAGAKRPDYRRRPIASPLRHAAQRGRGSSVSRSA